VVPEYAQDGLRVANLPGLYLPQAFLQGARLDRNMFSFLKTLRTGSEIPGYKKVDPFVADAGCRVEAAFMGQLSGSVADFFLQFPCHRGKRGLTAVHFSGGQLEYIFADRIPELTDKNDTAIGQDRDRSDTSGMQNNLPDGGAPGSLPDGIDVQGNDLAAINFFVIDNRSFGILECHHASRDSIHSNIYINPATQKKTPRIPPILQNFILFFDL
jgi:hypothetical protein